MSEDRTFDEAQRYCGNYGDAWSAAGKAQLAIAIDAGLRPDHLLIEFGCGALSAACWFWRYLEPAKYRGVDPNGWTFEAALTVPDVRRLCESSKADLHQKWDGVGRHDFAFAHSVFTHAGPDVALDILRSANKSLLPGCKFAASLLLDERAEPTQQGWHYPGSIRYTFQEFAALADMAGFVAYHRPQWRRILESAVPSNTHDWMELVKWRDC